MKNNSRIIRVPKFKIITGTENIPDSHEDLRIHGKAMQRVLLLSHLFERSEVGTYLLSAEGTNSMDVPAIDAAYLHWGQDLSGSHVDELTVVGDIQCSRLNQEGLKRTELNVVGRHHSHGRHNACQSRRDTNTNRHHIRNSSWTFFTQDPLLASLPDGASEALKRHLGTEALAKLGAKSPEDICQHKEWHGMIAMTTNLEGQIYTEVHTLQTVPASAFNFDQRQHKVCLYKIIPYLYDEEEPPKIDATLEELLAEIEQKMPSFVFSSIAPSIARNIPSTRQVLSGLPTQDLSLEKGYRRRIVCVGTPPASDYAFAKQIARLEEELRQRPTQEDMERIRNEAKRVNTLYQESLVINRERTEERDQYKRERDAARQENHSWQQDKVTLESRLMEVTGERDVARQERGRYQLQYESARQERDVARQELQEKDGELALAREEKEVLRAEKANLESRLTQVTGERDVARQERGQHQRERDGAYQERDDARQERDRYQHQYESARQETEALQRENEGLRARLTRPPWHTQFYQSAKATFHQLTSRFQQVTSRRRTSAEGQPPSLAEQSAQEVAGSPEPVVGTPLPQDASSLPLYKKLYLRMPKRVVAALAGAGLVLGGALLTYQLSQTPKPTTQSKPPTHEALLRQPSPPSPSGPTLPSPGESLFSTKTRAEEGPIRLLWNQDRNREWYGIRGFGRDNGTRFQGTLDGTTLTVQLNTRLPSNGLSFRVVFPATHETVLVPPNQEVRVRLSDTLARRLTEGSTVQYELVRQQGTAHYVLASGAQTFTPTLGGSHAARTPSHAWEGGLESRLTQLGPAQTSDQTAPNAYDRSAPRREEHKSDVTVKAPPLVDLSLRGDEPPSRLYDRYAAVRGIPLTEARQSRPLQGQYRHFLEQVVAQYRTLSPYKIAQSSHEAALQTTRDVYDALVDARQAGHELSGRFNRTLATSTGDINVVYAGLSQGKPLSAIRREFAEQTGMSISKSTIYRLKRGSQARIAG